MNGNLQEVSRRNRALILEILHSSAPISRAKIAEISGLTRATITNIVNEFMGVGLVEEVGTEETPVGRKRKLLKIRKDAFYVIGIDISRYKLRVGIFNTDADLIFSLETVVHSPDKEKIVEELFRMIGEVIERSGIHISKVYGMGVGIPGPLDYERGVVISPPRFGDFQNVPLKDLLRERFGLRVWIDNDANVAAIGEKWFGFGRKLKNFVFLLADIGVGCGIVIDKRIYRGSLNAAGEIGHIPISVNGAVSELEDFASLENAVEIFNGKTGKNINVDELIESAISGEELASEVLKDSGFYLGIAASVLANVLSPEAIIIGGRYSKFPDSLNVIEDMVNKFTFSQEKPLVRISDLGERAIILGAAALALEEIVSDPFKFILKRG